MTKIIPDNKPLQTREWLEEILGQENRDKLKLFSVYLVGVRGYFLNTFGSTKNQIGIYDDALFVVSPTAFVAFNFNTDPVRIKKGKGTGECKGMAHLKEGMWFYQKGIHRGYQAFIQYKEVTVVRDGTPNYEDTGFFGINIHKGGTNTTSSIGCQTVYPMQWDSMKTMTYELLSRYKQKYFPYVLLEHEG